VVLAGWPKGGREEGTGSRDLDDRISTARGVREEGRSGPRAVAAELTGDGWCSPADRREGGAGSRLRGTMRERGGNGRMGWGVGLTGMGLRRPVHGLVTNRPNPPAHHKPFL
jgi:hypothetical protein